MFACASHSRYKIVHVETWLMTVQAAWSENVRVLCMRRSVKQRGQINQDSSLTGLQN